MSQREDDFGLEDEEPQEDSSTIRKMRSELEERNKRIKQLEEEKSSAAKEAREQALAEAARSQKARELFGQAGFPKLATDFLALNPEGDVSEEKVTAFLSERDLQARSEEAPAPPPAPPEAAAFHAGGQAAEPQGERITREQLQDLWRTNPAEAMKKMQSGEVSFSYLEAEQKRQKRLAEQRTAGQ